MPLPDGAPNLQASRDELARGMALRAVKTPPKPKPGVATAYLLLNTGTGKHQVFFQFPTGAPVLVATEP